MNEVTIIKITDVKSKHKIEHDKYEYYKKPLIPINNANQCSISVYEIPPGKAAYPYHYHTMNEEAFFILSGSGKLTTPSGEYFVTKGDFLFFPANEKGAHILVNTSDSEMLTYIDFDTHNPIDVAFYPLTGKIGIWGKNINQVFKTSNNVDYYDGEL